MPSGSTLIAQSSTIDPLSRTLRAIHRNAPDSAAVHRQRINEEHIHRLEVQQLCSYGSGIILADQSDRPETV